MHAVFLTFEYSGQSNDLARTFGAYMDSVPGEAGVVTCTWMADGATVGAFYVFQNSDAAECFLRSARMCALAAQPGVYDLYIRHFSTLNTVSTAIPTSISDLRTDGVMAGDACAVWQADMTSIAGQTTAQ